MSLGDATSGGASIPVPQAVPAAEAALVSVTALQTAPVWQCGDDELAELVGLLDEMERRTASVRLTVLQQMEARGSARSFGSASIAAWVNRATHARRNRVHAEVALAASLHDHYPMLRSALADGVASADQVSACVKALEALPSSVEVATVQRAEKYLVEQCASFDPVELSRLGRKLLHVLDEDGPELLEQDEVAAVRRRELRLSERDGGVAVTGWLDGEGAAALTTALDPLSAPRKNDDDPDTRTPSQRRADALVEIAGRALDSGDLPTQGGQCPHVTVTMPLETLMAATAEAAPAMLDRGGPLSAESARRIACDAQVIPIVLGGAGQPLDVGRASRTVPLPMRRALVARDRGCAFPSCDRPTAWAHAHHIRHWADGGPTSIDNLVLLCGTHHRTIHHTGWSVRIDDDTGLPVFTPPPSVFGAMRRGLRRVRSHTDTDREIRSLAQGPDR